MAVRIGMETDCYWSIVAANLEGVAVIGQTSPGGDQAANGLAEVRVRGQGTIIPCCLFSSLFLSSLFSTFFSLFSFFFSFFARPHNNMARCYVCPRCPSALFSSVPVRDVVFSRWTRETRKTNWKGMADGNCVCTNPSLSLPSTVQRSLHRSHRVDVYICVTAFGCF